MGVKEVKPLLTGAAFTPHRAKKRGRKKQGAYNAAFTSSLDDVVNEKEYWDTDFDEEEVLFADNKKRGTWLIWNDFFILSVEYLQWLALVQSLAVRWPWPEVWIRKLSWVFVANLDVWEMTKVASNMTYKSVQGFSSDSTLMPFPYWYFLLGMAVVFFCFFIAYIVSYAIMSKRDDPFLLVKISKMQRVYIIICQLLALPVGVSLGKVFHCVSDSKGETMMMYVDNTQGCFASLQWAYAGVAIAFALVFFIAFPVWMIKKTKLQLIFSHSSGHESYLQLKETEYVQGLDVMYIVCGFHIFSSFKLRAAHYRAAMHLLKFIGIVVYAALFNMIFIQSMVLTCVVFVYLLAFIIQRPYRVSLFNAMLIINMFCLVLNLLTGAMRTSFDAYSVRSVWFTPTYTVSMLITVNGGWLLVTLCFFIYLLLHQCNVCSKPIWPSLTSEGVHKLDDQTKKFMKGVLRARHVVERTMSLPPLFAPAHELSRQIQIINAYCREAEFLGNPIQDTLWHLLDELIEVHAQVASHSLFAESVKDSIRSTAAELMRIMPVFVKRLAQREYDLLLVSPLKRRLLLKMYCLGMFLNGRAKKVEMNKLTKEALNKVWSETGGKKAPQPIDYIDILQPQAEAGPRVGHELYTKAEVTTNDDLISYDTLSVLGDEESIDVDMMVAGIPSRSAFASPTSQIGLQSRPLSVIARRGETPSVGRGGTPTVSRGEVRGETPQGVKGETPQGVRGETPSEVKGETSPGVRGETPTGVRGETPQGVRGGTPNGSV